MEIVAHSILLRKFKTINDFVLDLGNNYCGRVETKQNGKSSFKLNINDEFLKRYYKMTNKLISKYGNIGKITFYEDLSLSPSEYMIFNDKDIAEIEFTEDDNNKDIRQYLSDVLENINEK
jgi:hypothetical protein